MNKCLICKRDVADSELDECARRQSDGEPVCPACTAKVRAGNREALDALTYSRKVLA